SHGNARGREGGLDNPAPGGHSGRSVPGRPGAPPRTEPDMTASALSRATGSQPRESYQAERVAHWDAVAEHPDPRPGARAYHRRVSAVYRSVVAPGRRVLEVGCGRGDLLESLEPAQGVGVDFSGRMVEQARRRHPRLTFLQADAHRLPLGKPFDVVVLS